MTTWPRFVENSVINCIPIYNIQNPITGTIIPVAIFRIKFAHLLRGWNQFSIFTIDNYCDIVGNTLLFKNCGLRAAFYATLLIIQDIIDSQTIINHSQCA